MPPGAAVGLPILAEYIEVDPIAHFIQRKLNVFDANIVLS